MRWHPYPQQKPQEKKWYLVTYNACAVETNLYTDGGFLFDNSIVTAWMELPKPYKPESEE